VCNIEGDVGFQKVSKCLGRKIAHGDTTYLFNLSLTPKSHRECLTTILNSKGKLIVQCYFDIKK